MAPLDEQENITNHFNKMADVDLEKKLSEYQLTKEESEKVFDLRKSLTENRQKEKDNFNNPEEFDKRLQAKYEELSQKNQPTLENTHPGERSYIPDHQRLQMADQGVRVDHQATLDNYNNDYHGGMNGVLDQAAEDGRGPQTPESNQSPEQDQSLTQEFNRNA